MNISEAIEILQQEAQTLHTKVHPRYKRALNLGIEALDAIETCRGNGRLTRFFKLPGETEE